MITPYKRPPQGNLTPEQVQFNRDLGSARILVENYFGRMGKLWNIVSRTYLRDEDWYNTIFSLRVSFTNVNVSLQPLRNEDGDWYSRYLNAMLAISEDRKRKQAETTETYRANKRRRLGMGYRPQTILETEDDQSS